MDKEQHCAAKAQLVAQMQAGKSWQAAAVTAGVQISQSTAYRLLQVVRIRGEAALQDGRHGHPSKLRGEARTFLEASCREAPQTPSSVLQALLHERFGLRVSVSQINRVRAALGGSLRPKSQEQEKNGSKRSSFTASRLAGGSRQPLVTGCCSADGFASSRGDGPLATHADDGSVAAPCSQPAYDPPQSVTHPTLSGSSRTAKNLGRDAGYTGDALAFLTGRPRAYGYRHTERFLAELAQVEADDTLTEVLARWTSDLWKARLRVVGSPVPVFYIDGHRKAVYADHLIPRGLVGRQGKVLGCRALVVLHDQEGHPLFVTTHRGDQHLTIGLPAIITRYELAADLQSLKRVVVDREGMAAEFLATLASEGRTVVTVLRTDQYSGLESFREVGEFVPLHVDRQGKVTREVALARFSLLLPEHPGQELDLRVALIRDLCHQVPDDKRPEDEDGPRKWDEKPDGTHEYWLDASWRATPLPAKPTVSKLIPIVTTAAEANAVELAHTYTSGFPAQENAIRDWLIPLGIDVNHGYGKTSVINESRSRKSGKPSKGDSRTCNAGRMEPASACTMQVSYTTNALN